MKRSVALAIAVWLGATAAIAQQSSTSPRPAPIVFVDVTVSVGDGVRIPDFGPGQFQVSVDGSRRRVVHAQQVRTASSRPANNGSDAVAERSAQYRLGIEPEAADQDGNVHQLSVRVDADGRTFSVEAPTNVRLPRPASASDSAAPASRPATPPPAQSDVAAWERLWGGADAIAAVEKAAAATRAPPPATPTTVTVPAERAVPASPARTVVDELFATYSSGDTGVVIRELRSMADFERVRPSLMPTLARWRNEWSPSRATFALEIAITAYARRWPNPRMFLDAARDIVIARPDAPGVRPDDDRFELRFHRGATALLAAGDGPHAVEAYLNSIQHRVALSSNPPKSAVLKDARLLIAQASAREAQTLMLLLSVASTRDDPHAWVVAKDDGRTRRLLEGTAELLALAAADEEARGEASVRRAFILYRLGANQEALALLDAIATTDEDVDYWRALIHGRVLLALGRQQEAIAAFERASAVAPDAQTPAVALTTIFFKRGDREQALGWAERARTTTENRGDPWPRYWGGNGRFLARWITELRRGQR